MELSRIQNLYTCQRFVSEMREMPCEDSWQLPKIVEKFATTSEDNRGRKEIFEHFKTGLTNCFSPQKIIEFLFNRFLSNYTRYCQLGVRNWSRMREITILVGQNYIGNLQ